MPHETKIGFYVLYPVCDTLIPPHPTPKQNNMEFAVSGLAVPW